jgi:tetratricopeptide (TPR) repeat protein
MFFTYNGGPVFARNTDEKAAGPAPVADGLSADELFRRGAASLSRNELAAALADLDRACALEPDNASFHATRAAAHARMKDFPKALADFDVALALDPRLDEARLQRAWLPRTDAGHAKALEDLAFLDDKLPPQSNLRAGMARRYDDLELAFPAIRQWTLWIANHPNDIMVPGAKNARCWARMAANIELDKALADCDDAIDEDGKDVHRRDSRGWLYLRLGKPAKARADFDIALAGKPTAPWSLYGRALARQRLGEAAAAQADLAAARQAEPKIDEKVKAIGFEPAP